MLRPIDYYIRVRVLVEGDADEVAERIESLLAHGTIRDSFDAANVDVESLLLIDKLVIVQD